MEYSLCVIHFPGSQIIDGKLGTIIRTGGLMHKKKKKKLYLFIYFLFFGIKWRVEPSNSIPDLLDSRME